MQQRLDRRRAQRGDPVQACRLDVVGDARLSDHAAIADQHHVVEVEALLQFFDLAGQGHRIGGIAIEHLDGDRAAVGRAEQAVGDLQRPLAVIAAIAALGERAATPFHVARGDVVEHERAVAEMAFGQRGLDGRLAFQQPVERGVEFVLVDLAEAEHLAEARGGGGRREGAGGGELGCGFEDAADQQREHDIAAAVAVGAEHPVEADPARGAEGRGDMAMRQGADDGEGVAPGGDDGAPFEHAAQLFYVGGGPVGEIAEGALTNLAALAIALAQQDGGRRVPVGTDSIYRAGA